MMAASGDGYHARQHTTVARGSVAALIAAVDRGSLRCENDEVILTRKTEFPCGKFQAFSVSSQMSIVCGDDGGGGGGVCVTTTTTTTTTSQPSQGSVMGRERPVLQIQRSAAHTLPDGAALDHRLPHRCAHGPAAAPREVQLCSTAGIITATNSS
ncbi:hypothetical protein E2C01_062636 [Portunus trituberculatus]|uniref:Uncharacterized protein n=1 Tax=Portunus trituberculatus TaxID=210409 RepID=A0A5B7HIL1_PORTR|nr:hypothetical protein [Portunus trituberculatus]